MLSIKNKFKKYLYNSSSPEFLFSHYFNKLAVKKRKRLNRLLSTNDNLLDELNEEKRSYWQSRVENVLNAPDNKDIDRVDKAGQIINGNLIMHNGIKVDPMSYYSFPLLQMLIDNKGVHEPQEEKIFQEVLKHINDKEKTMLELGAYWSFYSMWFQQLFPTANCYMVEPNRENLYYGKRNFVINKMKGTFIQGKISDQENKKENVLTVDMICHRNKINFIDILHSDIQGFELAMLHGAKKLLSENKVGYIFISTHSNELHNDCKKLLLNEYNFDLIADANVDESFSWDGILVVKSPTYPGIEKVEISKRPN